MLIAELQTFAAYQVSQKGIYSTADLVDRAENVFAEDVRSLIGQTARDDVNQAGRCLALDLPTASGFHIMRATETVLKAYGKQFQTKPKTRNWHSYITALKATNASPKALAVLDQIRDLHRNPTLHPEVVLSSEEATQTVRNCSKRHHRHGRRHQPSPRCSPACIAIRDK